MVLVVSKNNGSLGAIRGLIPERYTLMDADMGSEGMHLLRSIITGVVLVDAAAPGVLPWIEEAERLRPDLTYIGVTDSPNPDRTLSQRFYDLLQPPFTSVRLDRALARAWERTELAFVARSLKKPADRREHPAHIRPAVPNRQRGRVCELSKVLNNSLNQDRLLELFLDAVAGLAPVGKMSVLLADESGGEYRVRKQRGLAPEFCSKLRFDSSRGLIAWLAAEGRLLRVGETNGENLLFTTEALQEMQLLQAVVSVPLSAHGRLIGALNLGPKVTGAEYGDEELETLYILSGNVAVALQDIDLHHRLQHQKSYIESILRRMNSGVVAINCEERVITFNSRAQEILKLDPEQVLGRDLRSLPSPLGDLLYDTMSTARTYDREEVQLARGRVPLEVSIYQLVNGTAVLGSVMILDDISERKQLEMERRQADQLDVLNKFVGQLAHEIKNPMVAIQTFSELLPEKYEDGDFRDFFTRTVRQEVKRLNELVEQLIAFSSPLSYKFVVCEIHEVLRLGVSLLREQGKGTDMTVEAAYCEELLYVRADRILLARAFSYLLNSFLPNEQGGSIHIKTVGDQSLFSHGGVVIAFRSLGISVAGEEPENMFNPLRVIRNSHISLELPVSRKIIEDHGGRIKASLTKSKGLEFSVSMPTIAQ
ncbi:MAG: histidine kinase dimerization/phospho-acceptor domain-containing protein [Bacillota bacterium]|jgi:PAS domain S-box-containing protein